jgi:hypothetical protein
MNMPTRRGLGIALLGLVLYLIFLIVTVPAYWLGEGLLRLTAGRILLQHATGSLWHGTGVLQAGAHGVTIEWNVQPAMLLMGKIRIGLRSRSDSSVRSTLTVGYRQIGLHDTEAELPAAIVAAFYPPAAFIAPTGKLRFSTSETEIGSQGMTGEARLSWVGAGGKLGGVGEVGDYQLTATGENGVARLRLETLRGDIKITGNGQWQAAGDGSVKLDGTLVPGSRDAMMAPLLPLLNARRNGDQYTFSYTGRLVLGLKR